VAAGAVATGLVGRTIVRRHHHADPEADEPLGLLPPQDLGPVRSFDGTELAVFAAGDPASPTLVFAHGFSLDMTTWHYQWTALSARFRCVLFDFRSHGRSAPATDGDLSIAAMAHDLAAVLEATVPEGRAVVVGHSMGAMAMLAMAESRPDALTSRVGGMVLTGAAASNLFRARWARSPGAPAAPRSVRDAAVRLNSVGGVMARPATSAAWRPASPSSAQTPRPPRRSRGAPGRSVVVGGVDDGLAGLMDMDVRHAVHHVRVPALVIVGSTTGHAARPGVDRPASSRTGGSDDPRAGRVPMMERHGSSTRPRGVRGRDPRRRRRRRTRPARKSRRDPRSPASGWGTPPTSTR
jgi:pimeloyl-ACP methyl ester carboxylesterase